MITNIDAIIACPICKGTLAKKKSGYWCDQCDKSYKIINSLPIFSVKKSPDVKLSKKRWDHIYSSHEQGDYSGSKIKEDEILLANVKFLRKYIDTYKSGVILDLGCGVAATTAIAVNKKATLIGLDFSIPALEQSMSLLKVLKKKAYFIQGDLLYLPLKNRSVDFIYSSMSLEYVKDIEKAVKETNRVLRPQGKIVAILPVISLSNLTYHQLRGDIPNMPIVRGLAETIHLRFLKGKFMHYGYEQSLSVSNLKKIFKRAGYRKIKIEYYPNAYQLKFIPSKLRKFFLKILQFRLFWPLVYVEAGKK